MDIKKYAKVLRYVDSSKAAIEKGDRFRLQPITLSYALNIGC
jgi:peptidyl-prolyl isomerase D